MQTTNEELKNAGYEANVMAETAVVEILGDLFTGVAYLDPETVQENVKLACGFGASKQNRSIRVETANYVLNNFGVIFAGLVIDPDFRRTFMEAVAIEIALASATPETVTNIRKKMEDGPTKPSKGSFVINLESYNENIYKKIVHKLAESFVKIEAYSDAIDEVVYDLDDEDKMTIGFAMSNFMYLYRAMAYNPVFFNYVKDVTKGVKEDLGI